jgi:hypothetical protein
MAVGPREICVCYWCADLLRLMFAQWRAEGRFTPEQFPPAERNPQGDRDDAAGEVEP